MSKPVCVVVGVGPGNGAAIARKFSAQGYRVALLARNQAYLRGLTDQITDSQAYAYDVTAIETAPTVFNQIQADLGAISVLVYNAGSGIFGNIDDATVEGLQGAWEVNTRGLFVAAKQVVPQMRAIGGGAIVVIGATASLRGGANFAAFASAKAAQRSLTQSMARHLGPEKIHVSYVIIDGMIDLERTRQRLPDKPDEFFLNPDHIAASVFFLAQQPQQAWTFELDVRPFGEKW